MHPLMVCQADAQSSLRGSRARLARQPSQQSHGPHHPPRQGSMRRRGGGGLKGGREGGGGLKGGGRGGGFGRTPPPPRVPLWSPPTAGRKILKPQSSWHRRRRRKLLAVSLKHYKRRRERGREVGGGSGEVPPPLLLRCTAVPIQHCPSGPRCSMPHRITAMPSVRYTELGPSHCSGQRIACCGAVSTIWHGMCLMAGPPGLRQEGGTEHPPWVDPGLPTPGPGP